MEEKLNEINVIDILACYNKWNHKMHMVKSTQKFLALLIDEEIDEFFKSRVENITEHLRHYFCWLSMKKKVKILHELLPPNANISALSDSQKQTYLKIEKKVRLLKNRDTQSDLEECKSNFLMGQHCKSD